MTWLLGLTTQGLLRLSESLEKKFVKRLGKRVRGHQRYNVEDNTKDVDEQWSSCEIVSLCSEVRAHTPRSVMQIINC